jgi:hypothetical protein
MPEIFLNIKGITETMRMLKSVEAFLNDPQPMQNIVDDVKDKITERTDRGLDYRGYSFHPYSKSYAKKKGKKKVDLRDTGQMMNSIGAEVINPHHGKVWVKSHVLIAQLHNKGGKDPGRPPVREFMNMTKTAILKLQKQYIDDPLMKLMGRR